MIRAATPADADEIAGLVTTGFAGYTAFAPATWRPPRLTGQFVVSSLRRGDVWCEVADGPAGLDGVVSLADETGAEPGQPPGPGGIFLWQLFLAERAFGTGLARELLAASDAEAARRGRTTIELWAAAGQARARRFYEREGFAATGREVPGEGAFGLPLVQYARAVGR